MTPLFTWTDLLVVLAVWLAAGLCFVASLFGWRRRIVHTLTRKRSS